MAAAGGRIVVFVVDTSGSMNQRSGSGLTLLDAAKYGVEHFVKANGRTAADRYFLITTGDAGHAVKAGWQDGFATFVERVKALQASELTGLGTAIGRAFDLANLRRVQHNVDTFGEGMRPWLCEPAHIVVMTDGGDLTQIDGLSEILSLRGQPMPGDELYNERHRWDHRLTGIVLALRGNTAAGSYVTPEPASKDRDEPRDGMPAVRQLEALARETGGHVHLVTSLAAIRSRMEALAASMARPTVALRLCDIEEHRSGGLLPCENDPPLATVFCSSTPGVWPIPEQFPVTSASKQLPERKSTPTLFYDANGVDEPRVIPQLPIDCYEVDHPGLSLALQEATNRVPKLCWQVFVANSDGSSIGHPFGFLRFANRKLTLNVLPYNYPVFWSLLDEYNEAGHGISPLLRARFDEYFKSVPQYYLPLLQTTLRRMGLKNVVSDGEPMTNQALMAQRGQIMRKNKEFVEVVVNVPSTAPEPMLSTSASERKKDTADGNAPLLEQLDETRMATLGSVADLVEGPGLRNPFDIPRSLLAAHLTVLRKLVLSPASSNVRKRLLPDADPKARHALPIAVMGNYQQAIYKQAVLRDPMVEDSDSRRRGVFGNPFRKESASRNDESTDEAAVAGAQLPGRGRRKGRRKRMRRTPVAQPGGAEAPAIGAPPADEPDLEDEESSGSWSDDSSASADEVFPQQMETDHEPLPLPADVEPAAEPVPPVPAPQQDADAGKRESDAQDKPIIPPAPRPPKAPSAAPASAGDATSPAARPSSPPAAERAAPSSPRHQPPQAPVTPPPTADGRAAQGKPPRPRSKKSAAVALPAESTTPVSTAAWNALKVSLYRFLRTPRVDSSELRRRIAAAGRTPEDRHALQLELATYAASIGRMELASSLVDV